MDLPFCKAHSRRKSAEEVPRRCEYSGTCFIQPIRRSSPRLDLRLRIRSPDHSRGDFLTGCPPPHLVQQRGQDTCPRTSKWMAERNRSTVNVDQFRVKAQVFDHCQGLDGKSFVQFDQADVLQLADRRGRSLFAPLELAPVPSYAGDSGGCRRKNTGHWFQPKVPGLLLAHHQQSSRTVIQTRRVASCDCPAFFAESRAKLCQRLSSVVSRRGRSSVVTTTSGPLCAVGWLPGGFPRRICPKSIAAMARWWERKEKASCNSAG